MDVYLPWEFKPEFPCRSALIPYVLLFTSLLNISIYSHLTTGIPFLILKGLETARLYWSNSYTVSNSPVPWWLNETMITGWNLFFITRLCFLILSFGLGTSFFLFKSCPNVMCFVDIILYRLLALMKVPDAVKSKAKLLLEMSHVMLVFQTHSFTNSLETLFVSFCLLLFAQIITESHHSMKDNSVVFCLSNLGLIFFRLFHSENCFGWDSVSDLVALSE